MLRRFSACIVALASVLTTMTVAVAPRADAATGTSSDALSAWRSCGDKFQCATLSVPVDYTRPEGDQVKLAVSRLRATDPAHRLGSLVFNFGGPGDAGSETLRFFADQIPPEIRSRYDLVSFDPRGTGASRPVECISNRTADRINAVDPTPNSDADLPSYYDGSHEPVDLVARCIARNGEWLAQLGSRNVARDLDALRAELGDDQLTYMGFSYGTVIGAVYAQMFPDRVARMVLDSPVDLSADALAELRGNATGFEQALDGFLAQCASRRSCAFHSSGDPTSALRALQRRFEQGLELPADDPTTGKATDRKANVATFYTALISALYDKEFGWPELAGALNTARAGNGTQLLGLADLYNGRQDDGTYDNIDQVIGVILCDDRDDPVPTFDEYRAEYERDVAAYPLLGGYVGSTVLGCDPRLPRPPTSEQVGDLRVDSTAPILVVGTTGDPATLFAGAQDLVTRLAGSRLLTFDSTEHTAYTKNSCIDRAVDGYLLRGTMPTEGTVCRDSFSSVIRAWRYVAGQPGREDAPTDRLSDAVDPGRTVVWIDASSPANDDELQALKAQLGMGATVVDAILNPRERTKLMRYGDYFHVAVHDCECSRGVVSSREIDIVTGPGWLVTVRHPSPEGSEVDLDEVARRFELQRLEHSETEQGFLLWAIFDVLVDGYFDVTDMVDDRLDQIEERVLPDAPDDPATAKVPREIFAVRSDLTTVRRAAAPLREVVNAIIRREIDFVDDAAIVHFHDVYDRVLRVGDLIEAQRDLLTGLLEANLAVTSNQLNQVMKKMTSWGAILIVATLIAGIYGMNFRHMPELDWQYGYGLALGLMAAITFVLWRYFKRKGWL